MDAEETLRRVYKRIDREHLFFGATIIVEDLIRQEDRAFIDWLSRRRVSPAKALAGIEEAPYNKVNENEKPGRPTPAGKYILDELDQATWVTNVELGKIALRAISKHSASRISTLLFGEKENIDWWIDHLGVEYSQAISHAGWRDYFADSPADASRDSLCYIGEPVKSTATRSYVIDVVWFGERRSITGEPAIHMLWLLYQRLLENSPIVERSEIVAYWKQRDYIASEPRPEKQNSLFSKPSLVRQELTKYWLNLPNIG